MLVLHAPDLDEYGVRQAWLADPGMMSYNVGWDIPYPGYDRASGCIDWPESEWPAFADRLARPAAEQGYYYVQDGDSGANLGHVHYEVGADGVAEIGVNVIPSRRGQGLGSVFLSMLLDRVWSDTAAVCIVQEFEDERVAAVRLHRRAGFIAGAELTNFHGRATRTWTLARPS